MPNQLNIDPPSHCQYAKGCCDQDMSSIAETRAFFIYPSQPQLVAQTINETVKNLQQHTSDKSYKSWESLNVGGHLIFCEICKAIYAAKLIVADITTLNFNVLFELGYSLGLGKSVLPVRDTSYQRDKKLFDEIGFFDTLGYENYQNSIELARLVSTKSPTPPFNAQVALNRAQPLYYIRTPMESNGSLKLTSSLTKSYFRFRSFDVRETPRLSLHDAYRETLSSIAVVGHLMDPNRVGAQVHNARVAFVCGMAMAARKHVLILQEGVVAQPIDYRDVVASYNDPMVIPVFVERLLRATAETMQSELTSDVLRPKGLLEAINIGDVAAENEVQSLYRYFVKTPQFQQAKQGQARLVVGRKGAGKSAIFYGVRQFLKADKHNLVLDLKPEGHQFTKLREAVLHHLSEGNQLHTMTAFWYYLLLLELANKLLERDAEQSLMNRGPRAERYNILKDVYSAHVQDEEGDFSERIMALVDRIIASFISKGKVVGAKFDATTQIYRGDVRMLNNAIADYLAPNEIVWLLFDNIDKGWPACGAKKEDIILIRCLLEATRKLQRSVERHHVDCKTIIFIRKDVYDLLMDQSSDRGKEAIANLDWSDVELLKELLLKRFRDGVDLNGAFDEVWAQLFDTHVNGEHSFTYMLSRTFLRPRDILNFVRKSIQVAVSRGHSLVKEDDISASEVEFSEDMLNELRYEIRDVFPNQPEILNSFIRQSSRLSRDDLYILLMEAGVEQSKMEDVIDVLLWFAFIGVVHSGEEYYSYQLHYNSSKLKSLISTSAASISFCIHPAFKIALMQNETHNQGRLSFP